MASLHSASKATKEFGDRVDKLSVKNRQFTDMVGKGMVAFGAAAVGGLALATKAAIDWESAWTGVTKTVDGSPEQMAKLEGELRNLARTLPATHQEIASVAEAAGQLGIKRKNVADFTKTMIDMGETTNLTAENAASAFAQFANVMGTSQSDFDRLGSTVVALGNAGASTEADIVKLAQRLSGAGKLMGASEADVVALASAMADLGIESELGGGAIQRTAIKMIDAVQEGGSQLESFAEISNMTATEFATMFEDRPIHAINEFVKGLNRIDKSGGNVVAALSEVGIKGTQDLSALLRLKGAGDLLTQSLDRGAKAWRQNNALTEEAEKRYATAASKIQVAWNNIKDAAIDVGGAIAPAVGGLADTVSDIAGAFAALPGPVKSALGVLGGIVGVLSLVGGGMLLLLPRIATTKAAMADLGFSMDAAGGRGRRLASALGKASAALVAMELVGQGINAVFGDKATSANMEALTVGLERMAQQGQVSGEAARFLGDNAKDLRYDLEQLTSWSNFAAGSAQTLMETFTSYVGPITKAEERLRFLGEALAQLVREGKTDVAAAAFKRIAVMAKEAGMETDELRRLMHPYAAALEVANKEMGKTGETANRANAPLKVLNGVLGLTAENTKKAGNATRDAGNAMQDAGPKIEDIARYWGLASEDAKKAGKAVNEFRDKWAEAFASFANPMDAYNNILERKKQKEQESAQATADSTKRSGDSWEDYAKDVHVSIGDVLTELNKMGRAQRNWSNNMITLAGRVSEDVLGYLASLGPEGAGLVQALVDGTAKELKQFERNMRNSGQIGGQQFAQNLMDAQPVLREIGNELGQGVVNKITQGMQKRGTTVYEEAKRLGIRVDKGVGVDKTREIKFDADIREALRKANFTKDEINRIMGRIKDEGVEVKWDISRGTVATDPSGTRQRSGGLTVNADGNLFEDHSAQIAPGGAMRLWAEPETGGEAYIPLAQSKRQRSAGILQQVAEKFGFGLMPMAQGGVLNMSGAVGGLQGLRRDVVKAIKSQAADAMPDLMASFGGSAGTGSVRAWVLQAMRMTGVPASWFAPLVGLAMHESGGNPRAINLWDSNAAAGIPSKGLFQTIDPTFNAYSMGGSIWNPIANAVAAIRYILSRYGSIFSIPSYVGGSSFSGGYADGGRIPGSPSRRDNTVVGAATGEFIVNADATSRNLPLLEAINSGSLEGFAEGGLVKRRKAMREILSHLKGGGNLFADFTFEGMSKLARKFSDEIAKAFRQTGKDFSRQAIKGFLDARLPNPRQGMLSLARAEQPLFGNRQSGQFDRLIDRFKGGIQQSDDPLRKQLREMNKTMRSLSRLLHKADAHWFGRRVGQVRERMVNLLKRRERIDDRLEKAISLRDKRVSHRREVAGGLRSGIMGMRNMVGGFGIDHDGSFAASDIANSLEGNLEKAEKFQRLLRRMRRRGFRANVIGQIAAAGPEEGFDTAKALAGADKSEVQRINRSFVGIHKAAHNFSQEIGNKLYGAGIQAARGLVKGLRSRRRQIQRTMRDIARSLLRHMRRALKIQSPSKEMANLGDLTGQGFVAGLDRSMGGARKVMDRNVADMTKLRPFVPGQMGGHGRADVHLHFNLNAPHFVGSNEDLVRVLRTEIKSNDTIRRELKKALNA